MAYHVTGALNAVLFSLALAGIGHQLALVHRRRREGAPGATEVLSLNQLSVSFFAYWAFFVYGYCIEPFNPYLVWPRLAGATLVLAVIGEVALDRRTRRARWAAGLGAFAVCLGLVGLASGVTLPGRWLALPQALSVVVLLLVLQGFTHQILEVRRHGAAGAVSPWMHLGTFLKDASLLAFGLAMGQRTGWPLVLLSASSMATKLVLLWHLRGAFQGARAR
jgi:hypothetical protein